MLWFVSSWFWVWGWGSFNEAQALPSSITRKETCSAWGSCALGRLISSRCSLSFWSFSATGRGVCLLHHTLKTGENVRANDTGAVVDGPRLPPPTAWVCDLLCLGVGRRSNRLCCKPIPSWDRGGRARKKEKNNSFGLQANNNQPKGKCVITQSCSCPNVGATQAFLRVWHVTSLVACQLSVFALWYLSSLPSAPQCNRGKPDKSRTLVWGPYPIPVQSRGRGVEGRCTCEKVFFNKSNWKVGDGFPRQVFNQPTPQQLKETLEEVRGQQLKYHVQELPMS